MLRRVKSTVPACPAGRHGPQSTVIKDFALCLLSAVLLILSYPKFNLEFLAWFAFVPAFFALKNKSLKQSFFLFFSTGAIFWSGIIYWLVHVTLAGTIALILYLALYFALFALIIRPLTKNSKPYVLIFIPAVWVLLEYIRGYLFTGFPWALLGYSQYLNLPIIQIADIIGVWGVSFLVMMVNVAIVEIIWLGINGLWLRLETAAILLTAFLSVILFYGYLHLHGTKQEVKQHSVKVSVIQGNIPQEMKWDYESREFIIDKYFTLTTQSITDKPDLIVWPESAMPAFLNEGSFYYERLVSFIKGMNTPLLLGAVRSSGELYYNSGLLFSDQGQLETKYDKLHLVPFGEYIPLRNIFPFLETVVPIGDFMPGKEYAIFQVASRTMPAGRQESQLTSRFGVLICFEDLFPQLAREFKIRGAEFLVNITNDAWFKDTSSPYQHLQASVFRAVENRVPLVRAANTGVSGFISPKGEIISLLRDKSGRDTFVSGYDTKEIFIQEGRLSFYTKYGDVFILLCLFFALCPIFSKRRGSF